MLKASVLSFTTFMFLQVDLICNQPTQTDKDASSNAIAQLTLDLGRYFQGPDSTFYSAMSLSSAMAMVYLGAKGQTANQISTALQYSSFSVREVQKFYAEIYQAGKETNCTLDLVNRLYGQKGFSILQTFLDLLQNYFLAPLQLLDFKADPIGSAKAINDFVNNVTRGLIPKLFDDDAFVNTKPTLIIMNAIYFRGFWLYKFNSSLTTNESFTSNCNEKITTQFMNQVANLKYARLGNLKSSAVQLDYQGCDVSMTIILPDTCNGISELLTKITSNDLMQLIKNSTYITPLVNLKMPKFELGTQYDSILMNFLTSLGIIDVFDGTKSDLSGITNVALAVDQIIQKAFISVDEEGTKAAVVTGIVVTSITSVQLPKIIEFHATRPFFFFISDSRSNAILFSGTYMKPS